MGTDGAGRTDDEGGDGGSSSDESMRERGEGSQVKLYVLLEADRWVVTGAILLLVFALMVGFAVVAPVPLRTIVSASDPVGTLFQALVTAIITGVTLVVTITQLVVSQELGPLGDQRERMDGAMQFRTDAEEVLGAPVSPLEPSGFLEALLEEASARAGRLDEAIGRDVGEPVRTRVATFVDGLTSDAEEVSDRLHDADFGTFDVLSAALDFNYSVKIYDARRLRVEHDDTLPAEVLEALDDVVEILTFFAPAREHVKTLYFQWELSNLSRQILYATIPALVVAMVAVLFFDDAGTVQGSTLGVDNLVWTVSAAATVGVAPFALLLAYVLRIATIVKRTLAIGPFVLRDIDRSGGVDWRDRE